MIKYNLKMKIRFLDKLLGDKMKLTEDNRKLKNEIYSLNDENQKYSEINKNLTKEINFLIDRVIKIINFQFHN